MMRTTDAKRGRDLRGHCSSNRLNALPLTWQAQYDVTMSGNTEGVRSVKFLGGAELARRRARKKAATRILRPGDTLQTKDFLSRKMPPMERFFASLFRSPASDFLQAKSSEEARSRLIGDVCRRLGLAVPNRLQPLYKNRSDHFEAR